jgi:hypothetical protein
MEDYFNKPMKKKTFGVSVRVDEEKYKFLNKLNNKNKFLNDAIDMLREKVEQQQKINKPIIDDFGKEVKE